MSQDQRQGDHLAQQKMQAIAQGLSEALGPDTGFCLLVFKFHTPGMAGYISNAQRESMIEAMEETIKRFKANQVFPLPNEG